MNRSRPVRLPNGSRTNSKRPSRILIGRTSENVPGENSIVAWQSSLTGDIAVATNRIGLPETIWWERGELFLLDQTRLPAEVRGFHAASVDDVFDAIQTMVVRGAPAIGVAAAYGMLVDAAALIEKDPAAMLADLADRRGRLIVARPTAVNLQWALDRMLTAAERWCREDASVSSRALFEKLERLAISIHDEDRQMCRSIGDHGRCLIEDGFGVLTHCNAGSLATSEFGTATSPMYAAHQSGVRFRAYADETRPRLQGAKLTAWELFHSGIDTTLLCDNMAASLMASGKIDVVIVGTDRVTADGSVANKIGTLALAIVAKHYDVPFYVALPSSTFDGSLKDGDAIPIECRGAGEVVFVGDQMITAEDVNVYSPAFDVTPPELVSGFITEHGILMTERRRCDPLQLAAFMGGKDAVDR